MTTRVPRLWPGETVVILGAGPSLTVDDVAYVRGKARVIAVNTSYQLAPDADCLWATDAKWWKWHKGVPEFAGLKYSLERQGRQWPGVQVLRNTGDSGLDEDPSGIRHGRNGGYAAVNLAVHLGAVRILLLGYDMQRGPQGEHHWHPDHPQRTHSPYAVFLRNFETLVSPLRRLGIEVINCSRDTRLLCFPRMDLREALPDDGGCRMSDAFGDDSAGDGIGAGVGVPAGDVVAVGHGLDGTD